MTSRPRNRRSGIRTRAALVVLGLMAFGCVSPGARPDSDTAPPAPRVVQETATVPQEKPSEAAPSVPFEVSDALLPRLDRAVRKQEESGSPAPRFDVTVDRAEARQFFMSLVEDTPYSVALAPGVTGEISLALRDVTVEEVLDTLQQAYGYGFEKTRTGFLVLPAGLRTQVFHLDYMNLQRSGSSETRVSAGQISEVMSGDTGEGTGAGSRIQTTSESDLWNEVVASVQSIVGTGEGRSVDASPNAGLLVVRAFPNEQEKVAEYLRWAEANLNRVVILEAKILEVTLNKGFQSGINWAQMATHNGDRGVIGQGGGGSVFENNGYADSRGSSQNLGPPLEDLFAGTAGSAFGGVFSLAIQAEKFSAFIELLETQGKVRTLSNPRISTVNNQKAVIKVGSDEFFVTEVSTTTVTGTATTSTPNVTLTPFFSGIALDVTPQISDAEDVILHVHPSITEVTDQTKVFTIADETIELPLALSSIRESDSVVRAKSGQIVVIGGLIQNDSSDETSGVPWISQIPWLGRLFEHSQVTSRQTELVILLRPIVVGPTEWNDELRQTSERVGEIWNTGRTNPDPEIYMDGWLPPVSESGEF